MSPKIPRRTHLSTQATSRAARSLRPSRSSTSRPANARFRKRSSASAASLNARSNARRLNPAWTRPLRLQVQNAPMSIRLSAHPSIVPAWCPHRFLRFPRSRAAAVAARSSMAEAAALAVSAEVSSEASSAAAAAEAAMSRSARPPRLLVVRSRVRISSSISTTRLRPLLRAAASAPRPVRFRPLLRRVQSALRQAVFQPALARPRAMFPARPAP